MSHPILRATLVVALCAAGAVACEEMNRPAYVPKSTPRHECFSDVECPGGKCFKGPNDVQGVCGKPETASTADGGPMIVVAEAGAPLPPPGAGDGHTPTQDTPAPAPSPSPLPPPPPPPPPSPGDTEI